MDDEVILKAWDAMKDPIVRQKDIEFSDFVSSFTEEYFKNKLIDKK